MNGNINLTNPLPVLTEAKGKLPVDGVQITLPSISDDFYKCYHPSLVASAALAASRAHLRCAPIWNKYLENLTGYEWSDLRTAVHKMHRFVSCKNARVSQPGTHAAKTRNRIFSIKTWGGTEKLHNCVAFALTNCMPVLTAFLGLRSDCCLIQHRTCVSLSCVFGRFTSDDHF